MTAKPGFTPASDVEQLRQRCNLALQAVGNLLETLTGDLPQPVQDAIAGILASGGRVGLELTVDRVAENRICVMGIDADGERHTLATIATAAREVAH
ncbi:hypothetical protein ACWKW4_08090 [Hydrogenophaga borbori]